jgi:hypothetical protein
METPAANDTIPVQTASALHKDEYTGYRIRHIAFVHPCPDIPAPFKNNLQNHGRK